MTRLSFLKGFVELGEIRHVEIPTYRHIEIASLAPVERVGDEDHESLFHERIGHEHAAVAAVDPFVRFCLNAQVGQAVQVIAPLGTGHFLFADSEPRSMVMHNQHRRKTFSGGMWWYEQCGCVPVQENNR